MVVLKYWVLVVCDSSFGVLISRVVLVFMGLGRRGFAEEEREFLEGCCGVGWEGWVSGWRG